MQHKHKSAIKLTSNAVMQVKSLLAKRDKSVIGLRVGVKSGGCSGLTYYVEYADAPKQFDEIVEHGGITILIDQKALMYVIGMEMDYVTEQFKSGFVFINPNEKGQCGCGKSFNV